MTKEKKTNEIWLQTELQRIMKTYYRLTLSEAIKKGIAAKKAKSRPKK